MPPILSLRAWRWKSCAASFPTDCRPRSFGLSSTFSCLRRLRRKKEISCVSPPDLKEIEKQLGVTRNRLNEVIRLLERDGTVARVATDLYFLSSCVDKVRGVLYRFLTEKGEITAAAFRDLLGSSRKYTIALLEYFDREGMTIRVGDIRRLKSNPVMGKQGVSR